MFISELDETIRRHANQLLTSVPDQNDPINSQNDPIDNDSVSIIDFSNDSNDEPANDNYDEPEQFFDAISNEIPVDSGELMASEGCTDLSISANELRRSSRIRKPPDRLDL